MEKNDRKDILLKTSLFGFNKKKVMECFEQLEKEKEDYKKLYLAADARLRAVKAQIVKLSESSKSFESSSEGNFESSSEGAEAEASGELSRLDFDSALYSAAEHIKKINGFAEDNSEAEVSGDGEAPCEGEAEVAGDGDGACEGEAEVSYDGEAPCESDGEAPCNVEKAEISGDDNGVCKSNDVDRKSVV